MSLLHSESLRLADCRCSTIDEYDNMITVLAGKEEKRFILHQTAVCAKSKFFKAACSKKWREGQERIVRLPEAGVATFKTYCDWVYSGDVAKDTCTSKSAKSDQCAAQASSVGLYLLGDILDDVQLRNKVVPMLFSSMRCLNMLPCTSGVRHIWNSTPSGSLLRKVVVDVFVLRLDRSTLSDRVSDYPVDFVREVAVVSMKAAPSISWKEMVEKIPQYMESEGLEKSIT